MPVAQYQSYTVTADIKIGVGKYDNAEIDGSRGATFAIPGVYDLWSNEDGKKVQFEGDVYTYEIRITINADGIWIWKDPSISMDYSGKWNELNK
jgi:hypothetical protein